MHLAAAPPSGLAGGSCTLSTLKMIRYQCFYLLLEIKVLESVVAVLTLSARISSHRMASWLSHWGLHNIQMVLFASISMRACVCVQCQA